MGLRTSELFLPIHVGQEGSPLSFETKPRAKLSPGPAQGPLQGKVLCSRPWRVT